MNEKKIDIKEKKPRNSINNIGDSHPVKRCQICDFPDLKSVISIGYLFQVNKLKKIGSKLGEEIVFPAELLYCPRCHLVQLGFIVDPKILYPPEYPYTSSTTKILRENFAELYQECLSRMSLGKKDLVVDIGSNDGNLLSNFKGFHRILGITPEKIGNIAIERGIPTMIDFFNDASAERILKQEGKAKLITATNVFAHIEDVNKTVDNILKLLAPSGIFISESHYLLDLIEMLQYDTIYHEHLRCYSLHSLKYLLEKHGLEIFHAKRIPTHGGSIRVYASRTGEHAVEDAVSQLLQKEDREILDEKKLDNFSKNVIVSKLELYSLLLKIKKQGGRIYGISAPSRASTLIHYVGLDEGIIECILEIKGSHKIGGYVPGTLIPILEESRLYEDQPEFALIFSWHIADELISKITQKGFKGSFIIPLPHPRIEKSR